MGKFTGDEIFLEVVGRINRMLILLGLFFLIYFLLETKINIFLLLLSLLNLVFSLISYKHLMITNKLAAELERARTSLGDISKEIREMHPS